MIEIIKMIKVSKQCNCLSLGERSYESYKKLFEAGADRYLLRHETATKNYMKGYIQVAALKIEDNA